MPLTPRTVLLLAGRLAPWADARLIRPLVDRLDRLGFSVEVVCISGVSVLGDLPHLAEYPGLGSRWQQAWTLRRLCLGHGPSRPDLLHVLHQEMTRVGLILAEHWRAPYVQTIDEFLPPGRRLRVSRRWCRAILATGRELADDLVRTMGVPEALVTVVPPSVPRPDSASLPGAARVPVVGSAGALEEGSGLAVFLDAASRVVEAGIDAEFVIAGQGSRETDLRRRAERLGIAARVTFAEDPFANGTFWNVLDVFCQTSLVPTVGRALATALIHGVPSIASDVDGLRFWTAGEAHALRVPASDSEALAGAILQLLADPLRARELGRRCQAWVAEVCNPDREAEHLAELYQQVLKTDEVRRVAALQQEELPVQEL